LSTKETSSQGITQGDYNSTGGIQVIIQGVYISTGGILISIQGVYN